MLSADRCSVKIPWHRETCQGDKHHYCVLLWIAALEDTHTDQDAQKDAHSGEQLNL